MSDFDELKQALDRATPQPDADHRAQTIAQAMKNFDHASQGMGDDARLTSETARKSLFGGLKMILQNNARALLAGSTALAAVALVVFVPVLTQEPRIALRPAAPHELADRDPAPMAAEEEADDMAMEPVIIMPEVAAPAPRPAPAPMARKASPDGGILQSQGLNDAPAVSGRIAGGVLPMELQREEVLPPVDSEAYPEADDSPIKVTAETPVSTFSIDVDTASWSLIRNSLNRGQLPPRDAVRIEEMVNYFPYDYAGPEGDAPFATHVGVMDSPWRAGTQLVQIGLQGALPEVNPPLNLVFLIDTSGSMQGPDRLGLLKQSFRLMLGQLAPDDRVSIVTYAGSAGRVLEPTEARDRDTILAALDRLEAGGSTAGQAGLEQAYATAQEMARDGAVSRVILATDGDFNVGMSDPEALERFIEEQAESGTYLSVLGFGRGNLDDATMQALAQHGNGMAAYIDTLSEAQKVLVDQLQGALLPIADDVKIQVEWNPAAVAEYRLIGYETRALAREDFNNDKVDAGEIGAGHQVTALYEITPVGSDARMTDPLRYGDAPTGDASELGFLRLRYKAPGEDSSQLIETPILPDAAPLSDAGFAVAVAGFGQLLRGSDLLGDWSWGDAIALAQDTRGDDPFGYRQEAVGLMRLAESLSQ